MPANLDTDESTSLDALASLVDGDPEQVVRATTPLLADARAHDHQRDVCQVATLRARALRNLRHVELAEQAIDEALHAGALLVDSDEPLADASEFVADAHLVAASIASFGRGAEAATTHLATADRHGSERMRNEVAIQRAVLAHRDGHLDEALGLYGIALDRLERGDDTTALAQVLSNRATLLMFRGETGQALADLSRAQRYFATADQPFAVSMISHNIASVLVQRGEIAAALHVLDSDEVGELPSWAVASLRAEASMAGGLFSDAAHHLRNVAEELEGLGNEADTADALLRLAEATRMADEPGSRASAEQAESIFARLGQSGNADHARLEILRSSLRELDADAAQAEEVTDLAKRLTSNGRVPAAIEAWSTAATTWISLESLERARTCVEACLELAAKMPFVEHHLAGAVASASLTAASGDHDTALTIARDAIDRFDEYRSTIGSPDARSAARLHAAELVRLGSELLRRTGTAADLWTWSEQRRRSVAPWVLFGTVDRDGGGVDERSMGMRDELRSVLSELREVESGPTASGRDRETLGRRRAELEDQIRDVSLRSGTDGVTKTTSAAFRRGAPPATDDRTAGIVGLSIDIFGDRVVAVVSHGDRLSAHDIGAADDGNDTARAAAKMLASAARRRASTDVASSTNTRLDAALAILDDALAELTLPPGPVALALPDGFHIAPWSATSTLRGRAVSLVPSLTCEARRRPDATGRSGVVSIAGPRLEHAAAETRRVADIHRRHVGDSQLLTETAATVSAALGALAGNRIVHIAAHTRIRNDNPMWSSIELADGPLTMYDLAQHQVAAPIVVLSSCESARSAGPPGAELPGVADLLLRLGAGAVIAPIGLLADSIDTEQCVVTLHESLTSGRSASESLADVRSAWPDSISAKAFTSWSRR